MLPIGILGYARTWQQKTMEQAGTVRRRGSGSDGMGGRATANPSLVGTFPCRLETFQSSSGESVAVAGGRQQQRWLILFPAGTDVRAGSDTVEIDGRVFEVIAEWGPTTYATAMAVIAVEM